MTELAAATRTEVAARRSAAALFVIVILVVGAIVWWPAPPIDSAQQELAAFLSAAHARGLPQWIDFAFIEALSNGVMFVLVGLFAALALRRRHWLVIPAAAAVSGLFELIQLLFLPDRTASLGDVAANTIGAVAGFLLAAPTIARRRRRRRRAHNGWRGASDPPRRPVGIR